MKKKFLLALSNGIYITHVKSDGQDYIKRISVEQ